MNGSFHAKTVRIGDFKPQLADVALSEERDCKDKEK
jgi:hypothetical protein